MSDLVARLRFAGSDDALGIGEAWRLLDEAADEIERLQAELSGQRDGEAQDTICDVADTLRRERDEAQARVEDYHRSLVAQSALLHGTSNERDDLRALLTAVAQSGVSWTTRDYVVAQIDRATWDAVRRIGGRQ